MVESKIKTTTEVARLLQGRGVKISPRGQAVAKGQMDHGYMIHVYLKRDGDLAGLLVGYCTFESTDAAGPIAAEIAQHLEPGLVLTLDWHPKPTQSGCEPVDYAAPMEQVPEAKGSWWTRTRARFGIG